MAKSPFQNRNSVWILYHRPPFLSKQKRFVTSMRFSKHAMLRNWNCLLQQCHMPLHPIKPWHRSEMKIRLHLLSFATQMLNIYMFCIGSSSNSSSSSTSTFATQFYTHYLRRRFFLGLRIIQLHLQPTSSLKHHPVSPHTYNTIILLHA